MASSPLGLFKNFVIFVLFTVTSAELSTNFYSTSCPDLFPTVRSVVHSAISKQTLIGASLLRLHFHDCFANGCDASNLLDDTSSFASEKNVPPNLNSARGFEVIDDIKSAVEKVCPGIVSCADILAITARDSVAILGGPSWDVKLGRRDAKRANQSAVIGIPRQGFDLNALISSFNAAGLSHRDMVTLSGSHTIGLANCGTFKARIYNETNNLDPSFAAIQQRNCPRAASAGSNKFAPLDIQSPTAFNNDYYTNLINKKGLLHSDQQLYNGGSTDAIVKEYSTNPHKFSSDYVAAIIKMGDNKVITGSDGEIRKNCRKPNQED